VITKGYEDPCSKSTVAGSKFTVACTKFTVTGSVESGSLTGTLTTQEVIMEEERHVRKSNSFVEGRYRFTANEQKVLMAVISKIRISDKEFHPYRLTWGELQEISRGNLNSTNKIDRACQSLKSKTIKVREGRKHDNFGFLSGWTVMPGSWVEFRIDPSMRDMLLDLLESGRFTLYRIESVMSLNSAYCIRLYEIMKSHQFKKGWVKITLKDLKWSLGMPEKSSYDHFGIFRAQVLDKCKRDIEKHTDIKFDYREVKERRSIVAIEVQVTENKNFRKKIKTKISRREHAKDGDTVVIGGQEFVINGDCARDEQGNPIPIGRINQWIKDGSAHLK